MFDSIQLIMQNELQMLNLDFKAGVVIKNDPSFP